jgi:hypothetical protein
MKFTISQRFTNATPARVMAAYTDPAMYPTLEGLTKIATPEVVSRDARDQTIDLTLRMRFIAPVNAAVRRVVDPAKISWLQHEHYDLDARTADVVFEPENYADRFSSSGRTQFGVDPTDASGTIRTITGDVRIRVMLVGGQVEGALVSGLKEHFAEEQPLVQRWLDDHPR